MKNNVALCMTPAQARMCLTALNTMQKSHFTRTQKTVYANVIDELEFVLKSNEKRR